MAAANVGRMAGRFAFRARAARPQFHPRSSGAQPQYQFHRSLPRSFEEARIKTRLRRELVSLFPLHNATASSRLVSLISGGSKSLELLSLGQSALSSQSETIREGVGFRRVLAMAARLVVAGRVAAPPARLLSPSPRVHRATFVTTSRSSGGFHLEQDGLSSSSSRSAVPLSPVPKKRNATRISLGAAVLRNFQAGFEHFSRLKDDG
ncbi:uncharacterized protein LOC112350093 isoform X2 [Selaginella moellendorffii]|uniref:uncharacterized protein LOC112350093 isoform X1 n=1 Tax=Selaginella moellendorffii TaxID=88036 RepID=UPI000D1D0532|nr:uncharacterized protein LOC112350093 isoform X1 [Selaginella moellendorffii]XP_024541496.1 uncharacterized protein LOC112350093 isoform X2 [Selaginella moellendorffii]|eukprot:XP_024541495.1 uncharacterized protein LOC112350093 isoform X1 [Selaginella moellendorffii]